MVKNFFTELQGCNAGTKRNLSIMDKGPQCDKKLDADCAHYLSRRGRPEAMAYTGYWFRFTGAEYYHLDVSLEQDFIDIAENIKNTHGYIDILFNNAGIIGTDDKSALQDPENTSLKDWHYIHNINLI